MLRKLLVRLHPEGISATVAALGRLPRTFAQEAAMPHKRKTIPSFYCDDTSP